MNTKVINKLFFYSILFFLFMTNLVHSNELTTQSDQGLFSTDELNESPKKSVKSNSNQSDKAVNSEEEDVPIYKDIRHKKYRVRNRTYYTYKDIEGFQQTGKASWYGKLFHGRKTASGEIFNMNALTAAHRNLPLGTKIQVTNLKNGLRVILKVNDRGPFYEDRVLDVSKKAASQLGFLKLGLANVHIKVLSSKKK